MTWVANVDKCRHLDEMATPFGRWRTTSMTNEEKKIFCEALGISLQSVTVERLPHPTKRAHTVYRVSHPHYGEATDAREEAAWRAFCDAAERKPALPVVCQAKTKKGKPCANTPQKGEIYCGPHLDQARRNSG